MRGERREGRGCEGKGEERLDKEKKAIQGAVKRGQEKKGQEVMQKWGDAEEERTLDEGTKGRWTAVRLRGSVRPQ